jgi:predicted cupin superfamily sugar epimerase
MPRTAADWITQLQLQQHIEGGWFREIYRSPVILQQAWMPAVLQGDRSMATQIYFLLQQGEFSAFHRIRSDEGWHFYDGDPLIVYEIDTDGILTEHQLGNDCHHGFLPFCMIRKGSWFGSRPAPGSRFSLVGCSVSPGFDFHDFELAKAQTLAAQFPQYSELIHSMCRQ